MAHVSELTDVATVVEVMEVEDAFKGKRFSVRSDQNGKN
jgi:hypothetical protein